MGFDYAGSKKRIEAILASTTPVQNVTITPQDKSNFDYENGVRTWVGAIFVDVVDSTALYKAADDLALSKMMRAFFNELIGILSSNNNYRQIGIRGDSVYALYSVSYQEHLEQVVGDAIVINTFQRMFQRILSDNGYPNFKVGIGLAANKDLLLRTGSTDPLIHDYVLIGTTVVNATKLASQGNRDGFKPIVMDKMFYNNVKNMNANSKSTYSEYFQVKQSNILHDDVYHGDMINTRIKKWVDSGWE